VVAVGTAAAAVAVGTAAAAAAAVAAAAAGEADAQLALQTYLLKVVDPYTFKSVDLALLCSAPLFVILTAPCPRCSCRQPKGTTLCEKNGNVELGAFACPFRLTQSPNAKKKNPPNKNTGEGLVVT